MSRVKILCGGFAISVAAACALLLWTDGGSYWLDMIHPPEAPLRLQASLPRRKKGDATQPASIKPDAAKPREIKSRQINPRPGLATTLLRELPRQASFIAGVNGFALPACDRSVDFGGADVKSQLNCTSAYDFGAKILRTTVKDANGTELSVVDLNVATLEQNYVDYAKLAGDAELLCDSKFAAMLAKSGLPAKAVASNDALDVPPEVDALLSQVDPQRAFLAARLLHAAIAESGESPQRLASLVRAYSHLGESTRYLYSAHGSTFFARAMLYAERLTRTHPQLPLAHAARGYAYTLVGQPMTARASFTKARELSGPDKPIPSWATLADDLNHFRTRALFDHVDGGPDSAIASYFALLTVEHSGLQSVVINMARLALQNNPGALRVVNIMTDNSGVSLQHETTAQATTAQFELLKMLANDPAVAPSIQSAAKAASNKQFAPRVLSDLLATMDKEPATPGQLLPWSTYASISRDALFLAGFRRLYFTEHMLGVDPGNRLMLWWEILKDHRFAVVIAGFDHTGKLADREIRKRVQETDMTSIWGRMTWMCDYVPSHPPAVGQAKQTWIDNYNFTEDETVYDLAHHLWTFHGKELDAMPFLGSIKGEVAKSILIMCPDHPGALAEVIVNRWPETKGRANEIERDMGGNPQVMYALARSYRTDRRFDDAARLLQQVIKFAPDKDAYEELADLYKEQGNADKWLEINDKYLAGTEDFGLEHARRNEQIAYTLMSMKRYDRALPYAAAAGESGASWGMLVHAACLSEMGRFAEAEAIERESQERYTGNFHWYRWCQTTGKGDLAAARAMSAAEAPMAEDSPSGGQQNEVAIYLQLEGQVDRARKCWEREFAAERGIYQKLQLAMLDLEQNKVGDARARLEDLHNVDRGVPDELAAMLPIKGIDEQHKRFLVYQLTAGEVLRCLADAAPNRDAWLKATASEKDTSYRGCAAYFLGRTCELRGKKDDAKWWYRTSLQTHDWNFSCRPQSAAGLRRLGEDFLTLPTTSTAPSN